MLTRSLSYVAMSLVAMLVFVVFAQPALARTGWTDTDCTQNPHPGCDLQAGSDPTSSPGSGASKQGSGAGGAGQVSDPKGPAPAVQCSYVLSDFQPPPPSDSGLQTASFSETPIGGATDVVVEPAASSGGGWYVYVCTGDGTRDALYRPPVWLPNGPPGKTLPPAEALAERAEQLLRLPRPSIGLSPAGEQLVNLPTWLWLTGGSWAPVSATASVPGESVTATASPVSVSWSMGDGQTVTCNGAGTPYVAGHSDPMAGSPDCGYTYRTSSSGQPGAAFTLTVTVRWKVAWAGGGQSGTFAGLTTTGSATVPVAESQALNTR